MKVLLSRLSDDEKSLVVKYFVEKGINLTQLISLLERSHAVFVRRYAHKKKREQLEVLLSYLYEARENFPLLANVDDGGTMEDIDYLSLKRFLKMLP